MNLRYRLIVLTLLPALILTVGLTWTVVGEIQRQGEAHIADVRNTIRQGKERDLRHTVELARSVVESVWRAGQQAEALGMLRRMAYGEDGYLFVIDRQGIVLAHRLRPDLEGTNTWELRDEKGVMLVQRLIAVAETGGGYVEYAFSRPSAQNAPQPKLAYAALLDRVVLSTGVYIDDIDQQVAALRQHYEHRQLRMIVAVLSQAGLVFVIMALVILTTSTALADRWKP